MSGTRNWNEMSSSDEDSWFDDEEQQPKKPAQTPETAQNPQKQETRPNVQEEKVEPIHKPVQAKTQLPKKQEVRKQRKFLKDQELLNEYINKTVDDTRVIKAARVASQQHKKLLSSLTNARAKQVKDGLFIINFNQPEDLIAFIKDKIANRYRFFLQPYFKRKVEERQPRQHRKYNEERNNQKEKGDQKAQDKPKDEQKKKQRRKPRYEDEEEDVQKKEKKSKVYVERNKNQSKEKKEVKQKKPQKQTKKAEKIKEQDKSKKVYIAKQTFEITKDNNLLIKSQNFQWDKVIQQLESKKIFKDFKRVKITAPFVPAKLIKLLSEIGNKHKFFLDKPFPQGLKQEESFYFELLQNGPNQYLKAMHDKYSVRTSRYEKQDSDQDKKPQKNNRDRQQKKITEQKSEQKPRLLGSNFNEYFNNIEKSNQNEIDKGFDENEFVRRLKENDRQIFQKNKCWRISAQQELIESLLKLTHRLTKSTVYDVNLKVSMRSEKSILTAELTPRPEQKRRPKVDVSGVNGYLS